MKNYFNTLSLRDQLTELGKCRFMESSEFEDGIEVLPFPRVGISERGHGTQSTRRKQAKSRKARKRKQETRPEPVLLL